MRKIHWRKFAALIGTGAIMLQAVPTCTDVVIAVSSVVTAGSAVFIVTQILE